MTVIAQKLGYEWKQIYRDLATKDENQIGLISVKEFEDSCRKTGTNITREEMGKLIK
jgi:Ca2+-binding EF-hand superfamily protein